MESSLCLRSLFTGADSMILQLLHSLYERLAADEGYELAEPGFSPQKISFRITFSRWGVRISRCATINETGEN